jgi:hypothetical protein
LTNIGAQSWLPRKLGTGCVASTAPAATRRRRSRPPRQNG